MAAAPFIAVHKMRYQPDWAICDFKMTQVLPNHHNAGYFLVLFLLAVPLIISWFIIVAGNLIVALKLFKSPIKRAKQQDDTGTGNSCPVLPENCIIHHQESTFQKNNTNRPLSYPNTRRLSNPNTRRISIPSREDRSSSLTSGSAVVAIIAKRKAIRDSISGLTRMEAAVIKCTLSLSFNYLVIHFIFIMQVLVYVFEPDTSVFDLIAGTPTGKLYATLWYYMAMPVTGFVNTIMLLKHNKNMRRTTWELIVRGGRNVAGMYESCRCSFKAKG